MSADTGSRGTNPFLLTVDGYKAATRVVALRGRERISRPFRFDVTIAATSSAPPELGAPAAICMRVGGSDQRVLRGIVAAVEVQTHVEQGPYVYLVRVVPRLWHLRRRRISRVFQGATIPVLVAAVFDGAGIAHRRALKGKYFPRTYCVQYQETDLEFVTRVLAEEGIFYWFDHGEEEVVVLGDSADYEAIQGAPELQYRHAPEGDGFTGESHVQRLAVRHKIRSGGHVREREGLEEDRRGGAVAHGGSFCRRLSPALRFDLAAHDVPSLNGPYVVESVDHVGRSPEVASVEKEAAYRNTFTAVPATTALRPRRSPRRPKQVTETALVVGPDRQETYTDELGRVKVQFPWDLAGVKNEHSACWICVQHACSGAGWGRQVAPRVGTEVVVTFLSGDTDRPLITGCIPDGVSRPRFSSLHRKAKSVLGRVAAVTRRIWDE